MQDNSRQTLPLTARPAARATAAMPVQRGNYGVPIRQSQTPRPQMMDVIAPERQAPKPQPAPTVLAPATQAAPTQPRTEPTPAYQPTQPQPLFSTAPKRQEHPSETVKPNRNWTPKIMVSLFIIGGLLVLGGAGRFVMAGSTTGHTIAVGAVSANDGRSMTIQFTADDGLMHKFVVDSNKTMIPGTATEIAYRSGAPETSAKQVSLVHDGRAQGVILSMIGTVLLATGGVLLVTTRLRTHNSHQTKPLTTPVTA